jgi:hypothetical protein
MCIAAALLFSDQAGISDKRSAGARFPVAAVMPFGEARSQQALGLNSQRAQENELASFLFHLIWRFRREDR